MVTVRSKYRILIVIPGGFMVEYLQVGSKGVPQNITGKTIFLGSILFGITCVFLNDVLLAPSHEVFICMPYLADTGAAAGVVCLLAAFSSGLSAAAAAGVAAVGGGGVGAAALTPLASPTLSLALFA